jgi:(2Fe-2S) ferredoxin
MDAAFEIPQVYKRHVFACATQRPPTHPRGSCAAAGAQPLWERLSKRLEAEGMREVGFTITGCLGFCKAGPLLVVYPEGIWYRPTSTEEVDQIVDSHLKAGKLVEDLVVVLA